MAHRKDFLFGIALVAIATATSFNTAVVFSAFRQGFPVSPLFSVSASYGLGGPSPQSLGLFQGTSASFNLTIQSLSQSPTTLQLSFTATNPDKWSVGNIFGICGAVDSDFRMELAGQTTLIPENSPLLACPERAQFSSVSVSVNPGVNQYQGTVNVAANASLESFSLEWFAGQ